MYKIILLLVSFLCLLVSINYGQTKPKPPVSPKWVFEPWVWEDEGTRGSLNYMVTEYAERQIPFGAVIIDSPWEWPSNPAAIDSGYNSFIFDPIRYSDPNIFIDSLRQNEIHVILWITGIMIPDCPLYETACSLDYFIRDLDDTTEHCPLTYFWKKPNNESSHIDFFNPEAVAWWQSLMDPILALNVDGWKVDMSDFWVSDLGDSIWTAAGIKSLKQYSDAYYSEIFNYTVKQRGSLGMITARPYCSQKDPARTYAPINVNTAGWVGDQKSIWEADGLLKALNDIFNSADSGYAAIGSDIGGFTNWVKKYTIPYDPDPTLFLRWAQMGSMVPIMENGGQRIENHFPWKFVDSATVIPTYRYFAKLHHQLVPYLWSYDMESHITGESIFRTCGNGNTTEGKKWTYKLGEEIFCAAIYEPVNTRLITFPPGKWINYWEEDSVYNGGSTKSFDYPLNKYPIYIKKGAIIPMNVDNPEPDMNLGDITSAPYLTLVIYPDNITSSFNYKYDYELLSESERIDSMIINCIPRTDGYTIDFSIPKDNIIIRLKNQSIPQSILLSPYAKLSEKTKTEFGQSSLGWYHNDSTKHTWIKFSSPIDSINIKNRISNLSPENYGQVYLNEGIKYYVDREYTITDVPDELKGLSMIQTANSDKNKDSLSLNFHFDICTDANIYIAFDHRLATPSWLTEEYTNTGKEIKVSDSYSSPFKIWKRTTVSGTVCLGSNIANTYIPQSSMYFVFIKDTAISLLSTIFPQNYEQTNLVNYIEYYIDRDFTITEVPNEFIGLPMIRTANNDKNKDSLDLNFHFEISSDANIYIAFDHRLLPPSWLANNYINTGKEILVSDDYASPFKIWTRTASAGTIFLGSNFIDTFIPQSSMYFVFINNSYIKVFLEGCYNSGEMNTNLTALSSFPKTQPYNTTPWNYHGSESVTTIPPDVVDWVLVELRNQTDISDIISSRAAFLLKDGNIIDIDGCNLVEFPDAEDDYYYIAVKHRNHLTIISEEPVQISNNTLKFNFTSKRSSKILTN